MRHPANTALALIMLASLVPVAGSAHALTSGALGRVDIRCQGPADVDDRRWGGGQPADDDDDRARHVRDRDIERGRIDPDRPPRVRVDDGRPPAGTEARSRYDRDAELGRNGRIAPPADGGRVRDRRVHDRNRDIERGRIQPDPPLERHVDNGRPPPGTEARNRYDRDAERGPCGISRMRDPVQDAILAERARRQRDAALGRGNESGKAHPSEDR